MRLLYSLTVWHNESYESNMSTAKQINAYREIQALRLRDAQVKAYGMVPFAAKYVGKCGCGRIHSLPRHLGVAALRAAASPGDRNVSMKDTNCVTSAGLRFWP